MAGAKVICVQYGVYMRYNHDGISYYSETSSKMKIPSLLTCHHVFPMVHHIEFQPRNQVQGLLPCPQIWQHTFFHLVQLDIYFQAELEQV